MEQQTPVDEVIRIYRGFSIKKLSCGSFGYFKGNQLYRKCNSAWECISSIDEHLSP